MHAARHGLQRRGRAERQRQHASTSHRWEAGGRLAVSLPEPKFADLEAIQIHGHGHVLLGLLTWANHTLIGMHAQPTSRHELERLTSELFCSPPFCYSFQTFSLQTWFGIHKSKRSARYILTLYENASREFLVLRSRARSFVYITYMLG